MGKMKPGEKKGRLGGLAGKQMRFPWETAITSVIAVCVDVLIARESQTPNVPHRWCSRSCLQLRLPPAWNMSRAAGEGEIQRLRCCRTHQHHRGRRKTVREVKHRQTHLGSICIRSILFILTWGKEGYRLPAATCCAPGPAEELTL